MNVKKLFRNNKQVEALKEVPLLSDTIEQNHKLKLTSLSIRFDISLVKKYSVYITYKERPTEWNNHGAELSKEIFADSWPDLIDKVLVYFKDKDDEEE